MQLYRAGVRHLLAYTAGLAAALLFSTAYAQGPQPQRPHYTISIVPVQLPLATHKDWMPIADYLSKRLNAEFELRVHRSFADYEAELTQGIPDFSLMGPYHQILGYQRQGYIPLVRSSQM